MSQLRKYMKGGPIPLEVLENIDASLSGQRIDTLADRVYVMREIIRMALEYLDTLPDDRSKSDRI